MSNKVGNQIPFHFRKIESWSWGWIVSALAIGLAIGLGLVQIISQIALPIALFSLGIALAFTLNPLVKQIQRFMPRTLAVVVVFLVLILLFVGLGWLIFPTLTAQFREFGGRIPRYLENLRTWLSFDAPGSQGNNITSSIVGQLGSFAGMLLRAPGMLLSSVLDLMLIFFVAIYWLILLPSLRRFILSLFPEAHHERIGHILHRMGLAMGGYLRGTSINGLVMGALVYIGLVVIGVPFPLALAALTAVLEIIPVLGPLLAGMIIVLTALLVSPTHALVAGIYMLVMQQLEGHILVPNIMKSQTNTSEVLVLIALFAGNHIGGLIGGLAAVPMVAVAQVLVTDIFAPMVRVQWGAQPEAQLLIPGSPPDIPGEINKSA